MEPIKLVSVSHFFIEVLVPSRESELSCLLVISSLHLTTIVPLYFRTVWYSFLIIIFFYLHNHQKYVFLFIYSFSWKSLKISIYNFWLPLLVCSSFFYAIMYHGLMSVFWRFQSRNQKTSRWRTHSITTKAHEHKQ